ncbi:MAG TPA: DUF547 domain-containing protein [Planktothrix sp.]
MKSNASPLCFALTVLALFSGLTPCLAFDQNHRLFSQELRKYAGPQGVHYAKWKLKPQRLTRYLQSLSALTEDEYDTFSPADKEAFWLDVYESFQIKIILDHYPIDGQLDQYPRHSLRQIPGHFDKLKTNVMGKDLSLYEIEHDHIRHLQDVRVHFSLACGANGCCPTPRFAYTGKNLDAELDKAQVRFLAKKKNIELDTTNKIVYVTQIFKWFPLDFAAGAGFTTFPFPPPTDDYIIMTYLARNGAQDARSALGPEEERAKYKVVYRPFDWTLNDADAD